MRSFKDVKSGQWDLHVNPHTQSLVKARTGIDLLKLLTEHSTMVEMNDLDKRFGILLTLTEEQRQERGVSTADFGELLNNFEIVDQAMDALTEAIIDFFPSRQRDAIRKAYEAVKAATIRVGKTAMDKVDAVLADPNLDQKMEEVVRKQMRKSTPSKSATDSAESSPSIPVDSVGVNSN